ncbi:MAG: 16S rRNA (adenine(1518)-N(6)/adenine(1519)-N(6))-dimethyltransferase RsmA [Oscillospiraceae bacterium]|nr:16S rRNA (adenine(1518)-N(6)/adenine(1519)-N(6))-dimethyltransferase RsmA [Oscillospiraceae bacterium]
MELCNPKEVKALLERHGFHFSKAKGQNFLIAPWVPREIAAKAGVDDSCGVLEIGPGIGPLTQALCERAGKVTAIEVDQTLRPILAETMADQDNLELIFGDVMKMDVAALVSEQFQGLRPMACANLPYYITSPILVKLLESRAFESVTVMVQKEVAQRICAKAGTANYSAFTVFCNWYAEPEILFDVPPDCFLPRPKVTSAVLKLNVRSQAPVRVKDEGLFFRVVRAGFAQRRKTLLNALSSAFSSIGKDTLRDLIVRCNLPETVRGEALDFAQFAALADEIAAQGLN